MEKRKEIFRSRISVLLIVFILAIFIPCTIPMAKHMIIPGLCIMGGSFLFCVFLFCGMRYVISDNKLCIKVWGISNGSINIENITSIKRSYNPLSSPASSLKRLKISTEKTFFAALISPVREREFIELLKSINPNIEVKVPIKNERMWRFWDWDI